MTDTIIAIPFLERVPGELLEHIVGYLDYRDAFRFSQCCNKQIRKVLNMSTIENPHPLLSAKEWFGDYVAGDLKRPCATIPILFKNRVHTVVLHGQWKDKGWGNRHGKLYVVATATVDENQTIRSRLVLESPCAPHTLEPFKIEFKVHENERYSLWYAVGARGGDELHIPELFMDVFQYDVRSYPSQEECESLDCPTVCQEDVDAVRQQLFPEPRHDGLDIEDVEFLAWFEDTRPAVDIEDTLEDYSYEMVDDHPNFGFMDNMFSASDPDGDY